MMNRVLLAPNYKLEVTIPLEKRYILEESKGKSKAAASKTTTDKT